MSFKLLKAKIQSEVLGLKISNDIRSVQCRDEIHWKGLIIDVSPIVILLMGEILHQLIWRIYHCLWGFIYLRWLAGFLNHQQ